MRPGNRQGGHEGECGHGHLASLPVLRPVSESDFLSVSNQLTIVTEFRIISDGRGNSWRTRRPPTLGKERTWKSGSDN